METVFFDERPHSIWFGNVWKMGSIFQVGVFCVIYIQVIMADIRGLDMAKSIVPLVPQF